MTNEEVRRLLADTARSRIGHTRQELNYKCEETCAEGATDVLNTVASTYNVEGLNVGSTSCNAMYVNMTTSQYWFEPDDFMKEGDYIFFDWDRIEEDKPLDHVGIVISVTDNEVTYANINGSNHNTWTLQTMSKYNCNIAYWLRYLNPCPTPRPTSHSIISNNDIYDQIHRLQELRLELDSTIQNLFNLVCKNK